MTNSKLLLSMVMVALVGCAATPEGGTTVTTNGLRIEEDADGAHGSFTDDGVEIRFTTRMLTPTVLDMTIEHSGMTLTYTADLETGVAEFDGFTTDTGEPTQMMDGDRATLATLAHELDQLGEDVSNPVDRLRGFASVWSEFPTTVNLQGHPPVEPDYARHRYDRWYEPWSGVQICDHLNTYFPGATHDCDHGGRGSDGNTMDNVYLSWHSAPTYWWDPNYGWTSVDNDHRTDFEYGYGECFGRCGAGCSSSGTFTVQCMDHDLCVRDGHIIISWYCDDEFVGTTDDYAFAPNC
jgi:hypothetical protein